MADRDQAIVTRDELRPEALLSAVQDEGFGAVASFFGTVRSPNKGLVVQHIDYEGYEAMILKQMEVVAAELRHDLELGRIVLAHRLGRLRPGEISIAVVVSSPHRREALVACQRGIDRCKELLPVWKFEVTEAGSGWVDGSSAAGPTL